MGFEKITYGDQQIEEHAVIISRLQAFFIVCMAHFEHPIWFQEILIDIEGNSWLPIPKIFFEKEEIEEILGAKEYVLKMLLEADKSINQLDWLGFVSSISAIAEEHYFAFSDNELQYSPPNFKRDYCSFYSKIHNMLTR